MTGIGIGLALAALLGVPYLAFSVHREASIRRRNGGRDPGVALSRVGQTSLRYQWIDFVAFFSPDAAARRRHKENRRIDRMFCPCGRRPVGRLRDEYRCAEHKGMGVLDIPWALGYYTRWTDSGATTERVRPDIYDGWR